MSDVDAARELRALAILYLNMAHATDEFLGDAALRSVTERMQACLQVGGASRAREVLMESFEAYLNDENTDVLVETAASELAACLTSAQKERVLRDLEEVAAADGVLLARGRGKLKKLAGLWGVDDQGELPSTEDPDHVAASEWGVLHDLAYIYIHLAHGTDSELSPREVSVMVNKLREWQSEEMEDPTERILDAALEAYGRGRHAEMLDKAIVSVRDGLPHQQRMAALSDLVKIANADGVFLDDEEDMINALLDAWGMNPSTNYRDDGIK